MESHEHQRAVRVTRCRGQRRPRVLIELRVDLPCNVLAPNHRKTSGDRLSGTEPAQMNRSCVEGSEGASEATDGCASDQAP